MKLFIIFIFCVHVLIASEKADHIKAEILESILIKVSIKEKIKVWSDSESLLDELKDNGKLLTTSSCEDANIIILHNKNNLSQGCKSKHVFVLNYNLLADIPQSFGALFYKKGRPNIVIIKSRVESQSILVSKDLQEYVEEEIW